MIHDPSSNKTVLRTSRAQDELYITKRSTLVCSFSAIAKNNELELWLFRRGQASFNTVRIFLKFENVPCSSQVFIMFLIYLTWSMEMCGDYFAKKLCHEQNILNMS